MGGEDDDSDVKDDWKKSESEEEKQVKGRSEAAKTDPMPSKKISKKNMTGKACIKQAPITEEEKLAEKLRMQKMEEDSKLQLARDLVGLKENKIDTLVPVTKEDFDHFGKAVSEKIQTFSSSEYYTDLIENVTKDICVDLKPATLKKLKIHIDSLINAKIREEKIAKSKPN